MNILTRFRCRFGFSGAVAVLVACNGGGSPPTPVSVSWLAAAQSQAHSEVFLPSDLGPKEELPLHPLAISGYVSGSSGSSYISVYNPKSRLFRTVTNGLNDPVSDWYDGAGNLYSANYKGVNVTEYAKNASSPSFTYSSGLTCPTGLVTDNSQNVYVTDSCSGFVAEYPQEVNSMAVECSPAFKDPNGVAVDGFGDVFFSYVGAGGNSSGIAEYTGGLNGCNATYFTLSGSQGGLVYATAMVIDKRGDLVVCDTMNGTVDIIPPPYNTITKYIKGFSGPTGIALNKKQNLLYVADRNLVEVQVLTYPAGTFKETIASGIGDPWGVAVYPILTQ
jgi:hypothetical protein